MNSFCLVKKDLSLLSAFIYGCTTFPNTHILIRFYLSQHIQEVLWQYYGYTCACANKDVLFWGKLTVPLSLYRFRLRNKKSSSVGRAFPLAPGVMGKTFTMEGSIHTDVSAGVGQGIKGTAENTANLTEGVPGLTHPQLISRGADMMEEMKRVVPNGSSGSNGSNGTNRNTSGSTEQ